jgi:predicted transcriptional regulator of viral defense system
MGQAESSTLESARRARRLNVMDLQKLIPLEEFDSALLRQALSGYSRPEMKIHHLLKSGTIVQIKRGLYVFGSEHSRKPVCIEALANMIYGPSALSLEWALSYHGLIPERADVMTSITPNRDKEFATPLGLFTYRKLAMPKYAEGIDQVWVDDHHPVLIATPEKALCDTLILSAKPDLASADDAAKFLTENLRIDPEKLRGLDLKRLRRLSHLYRKASVRFVLAAIEAMEEAK